MNYTGLTQHIHLNYTTLTHDVLNNWVKYGDDGKGFAIGFNKESFKFSGDNTVPSYFANPALALSPVKYIDENQQTFVQNIINIFNKSIKGEKDAFHKNYTVMPDLVNELLLLRNFVKNKQIRDKKNLPTASSKRNYFTFHSFTTFKL